MAFQEKLMPAKMPADLVRYFAGNSSQTDLPTVERILERIRRKGSPRQW
jgi:hypothetical protein